MKTEDVKTTKIKVEDLGLIEGYCYAERGQKYYLAYESSKTSPYSVLFEDLESMQNLLGELSDENLNKGNEIELSQIRRALKANVPIWELGKVDKEGNIKINPNTGEKYNVTNLNKSTIPYFEEKLKRGRIIICEIVD